LTELNLDEVPGFEWIPDTFFTGSDQPLFVLFRPNIQNNIDLSSPLGISVYANAIDQLKTTDTIFDSLHMEFMLGRKRIMIKPEAMKPGEDGPRYDPNEIVFTFLPEDAANEAVIQELKATLRINEHLTGLDMALNMLAIKCGFGTGHWDLDRNTLALHTATEVISTNSGEYRTLKKHEIVLEDALKSLARIILKIGNIWFGMKLNEDVEISVDFDDSIIEDQNVNFERDMKLLDAGIMAPEEFRAKWMNEDAETAKAAIADINKNSQEERNPNE
jgi:A118 family predicted phage portal protein